MIENKDQLFFYNITTTLQSSVRTNIIILCYNKQDFKLPFVHQIQTHIKNLI
jgi:hypothetical protein